MNKTHKVIKVQQGYIVVDDWNKTIATINHPLEEIPEIIIEDEVDKLAWDYHMNIHPSEKRDNEYSVFKHGYKTAQEKYQFTEEDLFEAIKYGVVSSKESLSVQQRVNKFIQSIKPQEIESVELEYEKEIIGDGISDMEMSSKYILKINNNQIVPVKINRMK